MRDQVIRIWKDQNSYKINGNSEPTGVYRALYSSDNTRVTIVHPEQGNRNLFKRTLITEIEKQDGSTYADFAELDEVLRDFFLNADASRIVFNFDSSAERDAFFATNLSELFPGLNIITDSAIQTWVGESSPSSYDNTEWHTGDGGMLAMPTLQQVTVAGATSNQALTLTGGIRTTATTNERFGFGALASVGGATACVALGGNTLNRNISGSRNTAVGNLAAESISGANNVAIGSEALRNTTNGADNVAVGSEAGRNQFGGSCTYIGRRAGRAGGTQNYINSTCIGANTNVDASNQVSIGSGVTVVRTTGTFTTTATSPFGSAPGGTNVTSGFVLTADGTGGSAWLAGGGGETLQEVTEAGATTDQALTLTGGITTNSGAVDNSERFGLFALSVDDGTTNGNSAFGNRSLQRNTTGRSNSAFGTSASGRLTSGQNNASFGAQAHNLSVVGSNNSAFGAQALRDSLGQNNAAFGTNALQRLTSAGTNSAFGTFAAQNTTTGSNNCMFGYQVMSSNTSGQNNSAFGFQALRSNISGFNNCSFGLSSGDGQTGNSSTYIGYQAGRSVGAPNFNNSTALGASSSLTASNQFVLGDTNITEIRTAGSFNSSNASPLGSAPGGTNATIGSVLSANGSGGSSWLDGDSRIFIEPGNTALTDNGNWKIQIENNVLTFDRREAGAWVQKGVFSNSLVTDEIFLTEEFARMSILSGGEAFNLARQTQSLDGSDFGDLERPTFISTQGTIKQSKFREEILADPLQPLSDELHNGSTLDFAITNVNFGKLKSISFECTAPSGRVQAMVYRDAARTELAFFSEQDFDFTQGAGLELQAGVNTLDLSTRPLFFSTTSISYVSINCLTGTGDDAVAGELSILGSTVNGAFVPKLTTRTVVADIDNLATETFVNDAVSNTFNSPRITNFAIDIPSRVDLNTDLNVATNVTYDAMHFANVASLTLDVQVGTNQTLTNPTADNAQSESVNLAGITTSSDTTLTFKITGVDTQGDAFESNSQTVTVRDVLQSETLYIGTMATNIPATVDVSTLTAREVAADETFNFDFDIPAGHYAVILVPANYTITGILETTFNQAIITDFTQVDDVRTISSQLYDSLVHQNQASVQGVLSTTITVTV